MVVLYIYEKGGNKVREQTFKFRSSTFIYAWNYPPIRFIFFFFISLLKDSHSSFIIFFFFYISSILINFSSKIFIRFLYNLNILYKIFRTQVCHILLNRNHIFVMIYIFIYFCANYVYWRKFVFKTDFIFSHGAFYLRGELDKSSPLEKWSWKKYLCLKWRSKNCFLPLSLSGHLFSFFEKIFSYLEKKICIFLKISYIFIFFTK